MTLNLGLRRIASLSAFLVAMGIASASQAGIIPWAYDVVFGPVRYPAYGYSPYAVSYSRPVYVNSAPMYAPANYGYASGCSSCSTSYYAPVSYAQPSYGCGPVAVAPSCGPCGTASHAPATSGGCLSGCSPSSPAPTTTAPATNGKAAWKKPAEPPKDPAPTPRTFQDPDRGATPAGATSTDGLGTGTRSRGTRVNEDAGSEIEVNRPAPTNEESTILKKKAPTKSVTDELESQPEAAPAKPETKFEQPLENNGATDGNKETTIRRRVPTLNLDAKIAWQAEPQRTRVPFHAKLAKASVTRRVPNIDSDWTPVVAKSTGTQLVRK